METRDKTLDKDKQKKDLNEETKRLREGIE